MLKKNYFWKRRYEVIYFNQDIPTFCNIFLYFLFGFLTYVWLWPLRLIELYVFWFSFGYGTVVWSLLFLCSLCLAASTFFISSSLKMIIVIPCIYYIAMRKNAFKDNMYDREVSRVLHLPNYMCIKGYDMVNLALLWLWYLCSLSHQLASTVTLWVMIQRKHWHQCHGIIR